MYLALLVANGRRNAALLLIAFVPIAFLFSLPAVFVLGGISLAFIPDLLKTGQRRLGSMMWWIAFNIMIVACFACLYIFLLKPQIQAAHLTSPQDPAASQFRLAAAPADR